MNEEQAPLWFYLTIAGITIFTTIVIYRATLDARRAIKGIELIEQANISSKEKIILLHKWRSPYASKAQLSWLTDLIKGADNHGSSS